MNREIKFRIWNPKINPPYMRGPFTLKHAIETDHHTLGPDNIIMQYTGLKDKNSKEIYEGDIVKILYTDWASQDNYEIGRVEWLNDRWVLNFGDSRSSWPGDDIGSMRAGAHGWIEVIGNIYQNAELLK